MHINVVQYNVLYAFNTLSALYKRNEETHEINLAKQLWASVSCNLFS